ncbi:protein GRIP-like isoform X2 [Cannabis sativa]|uniref:protein GRIP-like isoform X2 n=1 Tax=Cannabis sativa TaxID=3483 RepID=UPI0029C9FBE8|nr:protein GRIP-like isoform X2 [Cannabis sativa]
MEMAEHLDHTTPNGNNGQVSDATTPQNEDLNESHSQSLISESFDHEQTLAHDESLKNLQVIHLEANANEDQILQGQKIDQEIKEGEDKNDDLDNRAPQPIEDVQKDDELYIFQELHQELERMEQQASETLKAMDAESQHLTRVNNKLSDILGELSRLLQDRNSDINVVDEALQQTLLALDMDKMLEYVEVLFAVYSTTEHDNDTNINYPSNHHMNDDQDQPLPPNDNLDQINQHDVTIHDLEKSSSSRMAAPPPQSMAVLTGKEKRQVRAKEMQNNMLRLREIIPDMNSTKMTKSQVLQAAYNYIIFLKTQLGLDHISRN